MSAIRALISAYFDPALPGGGSQYSVDLVQEWIKRGFTVHVLSSDHPRKLMGLSPAAARGQLIFHPLVSANRLLLSHALDPLQTQRAAKLFNDLSAESIHIHNFHGLLGAVLAATRSGSPTIYTALDFGLVCPSWYLYDGSKIPCTGPEARKCCSCLSSQQHISMVRRLFGSLPPFVLRAMGKNADYVRQNALLPNYYARIGESLSIMPSLLKAFDAILTLSPIMKKILIEQGVETQRIHFFIQGADFPIPASAVLTDNLRLLFLGHMAPIKGFQIVAAATEGLPDGLKLQIRAYGSDAKRFVSRMSKRAQRYIRAFDTLIGTEVEQELSQADGLLIPSLWHENTPYAVLRTLASGRPVITSNREGISHLINSGKNGIVLPVGDVGAWQEWLLKAARTPATIRNMRPFCQYKKSVKEYADQVEGVIHSLRSVQHA